MTDQENFNLLFLAECKKMVDYVAHVTGKTREDVLNEWFFAFSDQLVNSASGKWRKQP